MASTGESQDIVQISASIDQMPQSEVITSGADLVHDFANPNTPPPEDVVRSPATPMETPIVRLQSRAEKFRRGYDLGETVEGLRNVA